MWCLAVFLALFALLYYSSVRLLPTRLKRLRQNAQEATLLLRAAHDKKSALQEKNRSAEKSLSETIALYDISKDIRALLDEERIFAFFKERLAGYVRVDDLLFIKEHARPSAPQGYECVSVSVGKKTIGNLCVRGLAKDDASKFHILAQQFIAGVKGAHLFRQVQELTVTDSLTHIFNRRYFLERYEEELARAEKFSLQCSFLMLDIDHFKNFNDTYGHLVGDAILKEVVRIIKETIRQIDFMGRYGGEELSIVLVETQKEKALLAAQRIRQAVEAQLIKVYDEKLRVTVSIGVATFPFDACDAVSLIEKSDEALYRAKGAGRNCVKT